MSQNTIFLISKEDKDVHSMNAFVEAIEQRDYEVIMIDLIEDLKDETHHARLKVFMSHPYPVVVISSVSTLEILDVFRDRSTYCCIGVEHGIAPFKGYTYGKHLVEADYYLAPTQLWADRLKALYPEHKTKVMLGGYPKVDQLRDKRKVFNKTQCPERIPQTWVNAAHKKLVVFSWGISAEQISALPDREDIIYFLHPASHKMAKEIVLSKAVAIVSEPELAVFVLSHANAVFGDFSSLTLEAAALGIPVRFILERSLYLKNCDLPLGFFDSSSQEYAAIPHSHERIPSSLIINLEQLVDALQREDVSLSYEPLDPSILVPSEKDNRDLTADCIAEIEKAIDLEEQDVDPIHEKRLHYMILVTVAYLDLLNRDPDLAGLKNYTTLLETRTEPDALKAIKLYHALSTSEEGMRKLEASNKPWPKIIFGEENV